MGICFSTSTRRGRKKVNIGIVQRSFTSTAGRSTSIASSRKTASRKSADEYPVEPASGFFSMGSDYSPLCMGAESDVDKPQKFGWHLAQEQKTEALGRTKEKNRSPLNRTKERKRESPVDRTKERKRESPARPPAMLARPTTANGDGHLDINLGQKSLERKPVEHRRSVDRKSFDKKPAERKSVDTKPSERKPVDRKPSEKVSAEREPFEKIPAERKPPERSWGDKSLERKIAERTAAIVEAMNRKGRQSLESARGHTPERVNGVKKSRSRNGKEIVGHVLPVDSRPSVPGPVDFDFIAEGLVKENSERPAKVWKDGNISVLADQKDPAVPSLVRRDSLTRQDIEEVEKTYRESAAKAAARDRDSFKSMGTDDLSFSSSHAGSNCSSVLGSSPGFKPRKINRSRSTSLIAEESEPDSGTSPPAKARKMNRSRSTSLLEESEPEIGTSPSVKPRKINRSRSKSLLAEPEPEIRTSPSVMPRKVSHGRSGSYVAEPEPEIGTSPSVKPRKINRSSSTSLLAEPEPEIRTSPSVMPRKVSHGRSGSYVAEPEPEIGTFPSVNPRKTSPRISHSRSGSYVAEPEPKSGTSPCVRPRKISHGRSTSFLAEPEREIMEIPANLATLLRDADENLRQRARSPSLPKPPRVVRNRSYPSPGMNRSNPSPSMRESEARPGTRHAPLLSGVTGQETPE